MPSNRSIYIGLAVVFLASAATLKLLPYGTLLQEFAAIPLVGSLAAALFQVLRDITAHERQVLLQDSQQRFALGASSHMANVAFDKHVAFTEEYIAEVFKTLDTLFQKGPTEEALSHANNLFSLRRKYTVWLTDEIDKTLQAFEGALRTVGANDWFLKNAGSDQNRQKAIEEMHKVFADILGRENMGADNWKGKPLSKEVAISHIVQGLRTVLGTEELTKIRGALIKKALNGAEGS